MSSNQLQEIDFEDLEPISIPYKIRGRKYILREASADATRKWRNAIFHQTRLVDGKITSLGNVADSEALLVSLCLFAINPVTGEVESKSVSLPEILSWPNRFVKPLFNKAREISDLEEKETPDTEESLTQEIERLTKKLEELKAKNSTSSSLGEVYSDPTIG